jgi:hypothetical protein
MTNNTIKHLTLGRNSTLLAYTVHIKDITYVNEAFDGPTELLVDVAKSFVDTVSEGDMEKWNSIIEDVIYEDLLENYNEEVVDFTIVKITTPTVKIRYKA